MNYLKSILLLLVILVSSVVSAQTVRNVEFYQEGSNVVVTYNLDKMAYIVTLQVSTDGGKTFSSPLQYVSGDVGTNVSAGNNRIVWDVLSEWEEFTGKNIVFLVTANSTYSYVGYRMGNVSINSYPAGATVKLDGKDFGTTPLTLRKMPVGRYTLVLENGNGQRMQETINVEENHTTYGLYEFKTGEDVMISSNLSNTNVYVDGQLVGTAPLTYKMQYGNTYKVEVEKAGCRNSQSISFDSSSPTSLQINVPLLTVSPTSYSFGIEGGRKTFSVKTPYDTWSVSSSDSHWLEIDKSSDSFSVTVDKNRGYGTKQGKITVKTSSKTQTIDVTQNGKFRKSTEDFSDFFLEYNLGYQVNAKQPTVGVNFSYIPEGAGGHLGFYLNPNYGFDRSFIGAAGLVTRWTHSQRDYSDYNKFDLQFYAGAAYKTDFTTGGELAEKFGVDAGFRFTGTDPDDSRFGFYSATLGAKVFKNEVIPTIGFSTGLLGSALIFRDGRINELVFDYPSWFVEYIAGFGANTAYDFWGVGATLGYVPSSMGFYLTGMGGNGISFTGGPIWRIIPEEVGAAFDWQVYTGVGYNSSVYDGFVFDLGFRFTGIDPEESPFGFYSATLGTQVSLNGEVIPTIGLSTGLLGSSLIFRDGRINEIASDYPRWFLEFVAGFGANTTYDFWGAGATLGYVPSSMGFYLTGMGGDGLAFTGGPVWRIIPEDVGAAFDWQVYTGVGYNSSVYDGFVFDLGFRFTGDQSGGDKNWGNDFAKWSATVGTQVSLDGEVVPTFSISLGLSLDILMYSSLLFLFM